MRIASLLSLVFLMSCSGSTIVDRLGSDEATAREAIQTFVERGEAALHELNRHAKHEDPLVRRRAKTAIGFITGQWGSDTVLVWKRSVEEAIGKGRPILVLQLFGKFDQEFC